MLTSPAPRRLCYRALSIAMALGLMLLPPMTFAEPHKNGRDDSSREERRPEQQRARISAAQAAALVQQQYGGKVMNVSARKGGGGVVYSVKILQNSGHMRTINVDGQSGNILN